MEAPPQFPGAPKKSKTGLVIGGIALAVVLLCCGVCGVGGFLLRGAFGKAMGLVECGVAIGQQRDALTAYAAKHGGKLPPAPTWQDDIKPYLVALPSQRRQNEIIKVPLTTDDFCDKSGETSITYNTGLAGKKAEEVKDPYATIVLFETAGRGRNKAAPYKEQPFETSPKILQGARRGWIQQPLKGQASYKDQNGNVQAVPSAGKRGSVEITAGKSSNDD